MRFKFLSLMALPLLIGALSLCSRAESAKTLSDSKSTIREFDLAKDSIGAICTVVVREGLTDYTPKCLAVGHIRLALQPDQWLILEVNRRAADHPDALNAVPPNVIDGVKVSFMSMEDDAPSMSDKVIRKLNHFTNLKCLMLERSDASDKSLLAVGKLPHLQRFSGSMSGITGEFLTHPENYPEMQSIALFNCQLNSKYMAGLAKLPKLQNLDLHHTDLEEEAIREIGKCKSLKALRIGENVRLTDKCLCYLSSLKGLTLLELQQANITANGLKALQPLAPTLKLLKVSPDVVTRDRYTLVKQILPHTSIEITSRGKTIDATTEKLWAPLH